MPYAHAIDFRFDTLFSRYIKLISFPSADIGEDITFSLIDASLQNGHFSSLAEMILSPP